MHSNPLATAADYADALIAARRAKSVITIFLALILILQLTLFFLVRFKQLDIAAATVSLSPTTQPTEEKTFRLRQAIQYVVSVSSFAGIILAILLACVLMLILKIMLVGRLIGAGRVTSAYIWSLLLVALLFPWQVFFTEASLSASDFRIPGVLYTWRELVHDAHFTHDRVDYAILKWARFAAFPIVSLLILLFPIASKSGRGLRLAMGEAELPSSEADEPINPRPL